MAELTLGSSEKHPVSVEITVKYNDGSEEIRREHDSALSIEAKGLGTLTINGDIFGSVRTGADLSCGDIDGDVRAGNDVHCNDVSGDAKAGAEIHASDIDGNASAGADIHCNDVSGNAKAGADIECNYVAGSVTAGGEIASMGFEEEDG